MDDNEYLAVLRQAGYAPKQVPAQPAEPSTGRKVADGVAGFGTSALDAIAKTGRAYAAGLGYVAKGVEKAITPIVEGLGGTVAQANVPLPSVKDTSYFKQLGEDAGVSKTSAGRGGQVVGDIVGSIIQPLPASPVAAAMLGGATYAAGRAEESDLPVEALKGAATGAVLGTALKGATGIASGVKNAVTNARAAPVVQSAKAAQGFIDDIAPQAGPEVYRQAVDASKQVLKNVGSSAERDALYKAVKPEIFTGKLHVSTPDSIDIIGGVTKGFERSDDPLAVAYRNSPTGSVQQVDKIVQFLNQKISAATRSGATDDARILTVAKKDITNSLDKQFPGYAKARNMASEILENVKQVKSTAIGKIAKSKEGDYSSILPKLFKPQDTATGVFQRTRDMLYEADPSLYTQLVKQGIQKVADGVEKSNNPVGDLVQGLAGTGAKAKLWQEALNVPELAVTKAKLEVLDIMHRASKNPGMIEKGAARLGMNNANVNTQKLSDFLMKTSRDKQFLELVQTYGSNPEKLVPKVLELMDASPVRKAASVGSTVGALNFMNKDKK